MMDSSRMKYSGGKIPPQSDLRVGGTLRGPACESRANKPSPKNPRTPFLIQFCNIRGLNSNLDDVHHHLQTNKPQILFLTETQLKQSNSNSPHLSCPGYDLHDSFRLKGGVCVYVRSDLSYSRQTSLESSEHDVIWMKLSTHKSSPAKFLCCLYRSPNSLQHHDLFNYLGCQVDYINETYPSAEVSILGDFNIHNNNWLCHSSGVDNAGREAEAFAISRQLEQLVNTPTRIPDVSTHQANTLDLFLTSHPDNYQITVTSPIGNSDHCLITAACSTQKQPLPPSCKRTIWHYQKADWDGLRNYFASFPWNQTCFATKDPSKVSEGITEVIQTGMDTFIPHTTKTSRPGSKPWFNRTCSTAVKAKNRAFHHWQKNPNTSSHQNYILARNQCTLTIKNSKESFMQTVRNKIINCPSNSKSFWSLAKAVGSNFSQSSFPPLTNSAGSTAVTPKEKAEMFAKLFSSNSTLNPPSNHPLPSVPIVHSRLPKISFHNRTVAKILKNLDTTKASGLDNVPAILLKKCAPELTPILTRLFSLSYDQGIFPDNWKTARIQPIPKKGKKTLVSNYRPIALLPTISKVMEKVINIQIVKYLESNHLINDRQYGFRSRRSTGDLLTYVTHLWSRAVEQYGESLAVALDISKAFDRVWHAGLLNKLPSFGFPTKLCDWFKSFLSNRSITVAVDGESSEAYPINSGVPQGSILSPTLFLIHINDLLSLTDNPIHSFADDSTLHSSFSYRKPQSLANVDSARRNQTKSLTTDLTKITEWGAKNLVLFNSAKTQSSFFSKKRHPNNTLPSMNNQTLSRKSELSILGVTISDNLVWHTHVSNLAKSASKKLSFLFRSKRYFSPDNLLTLYKATIRPTLEYCSHIWGAAPPTTLGLLDSVQRRAIRLINSPSLTNNLVSLDHRRKVGDLSLFYRYFHADCSAEITSIMPQLASFGRSTRLSQHSHPLTVQETTHRTSHFKSSFIPRVSKLWNSLPKSVFPNTYNLQSFKSKIHRHLLSISH